MDHLKVFLLTYLLAVTPITSNDVLSQIKRVIGDSKGQHTGKGCSKLEGSVNCSVPVTTHETRVIDWDNSVLPDSSVCYTYDGCFTCRGGSWMTSACQGGEPHHRQKRFWPVFLGIVSSIVGIVGGIVDIVCKFYCKGDDGETYKPPKFTSCGRPKSPIYAPRGERGTTVTWQKPTFESGNAGTPTLTLVSVTGDSGHTFKAGYYSITYNIVDNQGYKVVCSFYFEVKVRTCAWPRWLDHGRIRCGSGDIIFGDTCDVTCDKGYHLVGHSRITCEANEKFNYNLPTCKPNKCTKLTRPAHSTGMSCTDGNNYNSLCSLTCGAGFTSSPRLTVCKSTKTWLQPYPKCSDMLDPEFVSCPSQSVQAYADRGKTTAVVTWEAPRASDNSGNVTVDQIDGLRPGQTFNEGSNMVKYKATDPSGRTAYCAFAVNVVTLSCKLPSYNDTNLIFNCPNGYKYGSQCTVTCKIGLPLNGTNTIMCEKDDSVIPQTYWNLGGGNPPYCEKRPCVDLTPPLHGALACDSNMGGAFCQMMCNEKWDISRNADAVQLYQCGWATGIWMPTSEVPDCIKEHRAGQMRLKSELYYFSGDCSDPNTLEEIKKKFVAVLGDTGMWGEDVSPCTVEDVYVVCGAGRRKRDINSQEHDIEKRSTPAAIITWNWVVPIDSGETDRKAAIETANAFLENRANQMFNLVQNNSLDIGVSGFELKPDSYGYEESDVVCPKGYKGNYRTGTCSPCATGSMYNETADDCTLCPAGTYQDEEGQYQCKTCPEGKTSINKGSRSQDKCIELCAAGYFSSSSVVPCDECPVGEYQARAGSTLCIACEQGSTTSSTASTSAASCKSFDVIVEGPATVLSKGVLVNNADDYTISAWLSTRSAEGSIAIRQPDGTFPMQLHFGKTNTLHLFGNDVPGLAMSTSSWSHVCIVYNHGDKTVTVYNNGVAETPTTLSSVSTPAFSSGSKLQVELEANSEMTLRSLFVISTALSAHDVQLLASSCDHKPSDFAISLSDLTSGDSHQTLRITTPTTCDAVDECKQNTPCNGHTCINLPGSYRCVCQDGFSGSDCSIRPDYCIDNKCENSVCENGASDYTCKCYEGFKGRFCDERIVSGGWSDWTDWDQCSATCGGGSMSRRRRCDNPPPTHPEGQDCVGSPTETGQCNTEACPECLSSVVRRGIGSLVRCNGTSSALDCFAVCRNPDHVIDVTGRPRVSCSNGVWDSKIPKVASCTKAASPSRLVLETKGTLNTGSCLSENHVNQVKSSISQNAGQLPCGNDASCHTDIHVQDGCHDGARKRRSTGTMVKITLTLDIPNGDLQLGDFITSKTISPQLQKLIDAVKVLEESAEQLQNNASIYDVTVDGTKYSVVRDSVTVNSGVTCPAGTVARDMFCVSCSPGTYKQDGKCKFCDFGTYQDESGQSSCKPCPSGKSTELAGSTDLEECTVAVKVTSTRPDDKHPVHPTPKDFTGAIAGATVGFISLVILASIGFAIYWKHYRPIQQKKRAQEQHATGRSSNQPSSRNGRPGSSGNRPTSRASLSKVAPIFLDDPPPYSPPYGSLNFPVAPLPIYYTLSDSSPCTGLNDGLPTVQNPPDYPDLTTTTENVYNELRESHIMPVAPATTTNTHLRV